MKVSSIVFNLVSAILVYSSLSRSFIMLLVMVALRTQDAISGRHSFWYTSVQDGNLHSELPD